MTTLNRRQFMKTLTAGVIGWRVLPRFQTSARVEAFLSQMTVRQKVGQMFLFSLEGVTFTDDMRTLIADNHAGGMTLFSSNVGSPAKLTALTNDMQRAAVENGLPIPLFLAVDQEGGRVLRLQPEPYSPFPSPMALGAADDTDLTFQVAAAIGVEMKACGLNLNLAPVLDVNAQAYNPVINIRSFGGNPDNVARHGDAFIRGLQSVNVIATGKHFPGHGSTVTDSHYTLPVVEPGSGTLEGDMQPFQAGIGADVGAIMSAHILYRDLDDTTPATFSPAIMTDLLKTQMGFHGVLMSDALSMGAVSESRSRPIYALRDAIAAGVDMLTYGNSTPLAAQIDAYEFVVAMAESGLLDSARIDDAMRKILTLKERFGLLDWASLMPEDAISRMNLEAHYTLLSDAASRSVTLLRNALLPLDTAQPLAVVYPANYPQMGAALRIGLGDALDLPYALSPDVGAVAAIREQIGNRTVICCTLDSYQNRGQIDLINALPLDRTVIVAAQSPYDLLEFPLAQTYLMTYGTNIHALTAAWGVIFGVIPAQGKSPVMIE